MHWERQQAKSLETGIAAAEARVQTGGDIDGAIEGALEIIRRLPEIACDAENLGQARQIFGLLNARLFLGFQAMKAKKRTLNKIRGGIVTFGTAKPPVEIYEGPTSRKKIKIPAASGAAEIGDGAQSSPPESCVVSDEEDKSLGTVSREFRRRLELFVEDVAAWESHVTHLLVAA